MFYSAAHSLNRILYVFMFPNTHDRPARITKGGICQAVALDVPT